MLTQLLIAYGAGMVITIGMEIAKVLKARRMNQRAGLLTGTAPARSAGFNSAPRVDHASEPAANETALMRAAG